MKPVVVILLNWNGLAHTTNCLYSIMDSCKLEMFDIIVADNGSSDNSLPILRERFPEVTFIDNERNIGFAGGNNKALEQSLALGYSYSLLLNNDTLVEEDIISPLLEYLKNNAEVAAVQPAIYYLDDRDKLWSGGAYFNKLTGTTFSKNENIYRKDIPNIINNVDWVTGCCFLIKNTVLKEVGLFNESYFLYYEDVELSFRIRKAGYKLKYLPAVKVFHEAGVSSKNHNSKEGTLNPVIHYYNSRNKIWLLKSATEKIFVIPVLLSTCVYFILLLSYFILRNRWQKAKNVCKGIRDGLLSAPRIPM